MLKLGHRTAQLSLTLVASVLAGCQAPDSVTAVRSSTSRYLASTHRLSSPPKTFDDDMYDIATKAPGFAGLQMTAEGTPVLLVTANANRTGVRGAIREWRTARGAADYSSITWKEVRNDFAALYKARKVIRSIRLSGLRFVDLDENANHVVIAVASAKDSVVAYDRLLQKVGGNGLVSIIVATPIRQATTLSDFVRPIAAGLKITMQDGYNCTGGPIAHWAGYTARHMIVNSHCTASPWTYDGTLAHQPFVWNPWGTRIGYEADDPQPTYDPGNCGYTDYCRYADAARVELDSVMPYAIAKTTWVSITPGTSGSTTLDGTFTVTGVVPYSNLVYNQGLHKVGVTTGWTAGAITRTCVDVYVASNPDFTLLCQFFASGAVNGGDSGSPVFQWYGGAPSYDSYVAGILWGYADYTEFVFSPWANVTWDLGNLVPNS